MPNAFLTSASPQLPPLGFGWVGTLHVWLLLAAVCALGGLAGAAQSIDIRVTAPAVGVLLPRESEWVRCHVLGVVDTVLVAEGDSVRPDDPVITLRSDDLRRHLELIGSDVDSHDRQELSLRAQIEAERQQRESIVLQRRHQLELATAELDRIRQIESVNRNDLRPGWSRRSLDQLIPVQRASGHLAHAQILLQAAIDDVEAVSARQAEVAWLASQRDRLLKQRALLADQLAALTIRTSVAGVIRTPEPESLEGAAVIPGQNLLEIVTSTEWVADLIVSEQEWGKIRPGQSAQLFLDAYPHIRHGSLAGVVQSVSSKPESWAPARYRVHMRIESEDAENFTLAEGMSVTAHISIDEGSMIELLSTWLHGQFRYLRPLQTRLGFAEGSV